MGEISKYQYAQDENRKRNKLILLKGKTLYVPSSQEAQPKVSCLMFPKRPLEHKNLNL